MLAFLNPYMMWIKLGAIVLGLAGAFGGGMWLEGIFKDKTILTMQRDQAKAQTISVAASLNQLQTFITTMQSAANGYQSDQSALSAKLDQLHKDFGHVAQLSPLPVDCRPDPGRLHILSASIAAANAAAVGSRSSSPVPATP